MKYLIKLCICNVLKNIIINIKYCILFCKLFLIIDIILIFRFENDLVENESVDGKL